MKYSVLERLYIQLTIYPMEGLCMKKMLITLCAVALALSSCLTLAVLDPTLPDEETAVLRFYSSKPTSYNGIPVETELRYCKIPAGKANFVLDIWPTYGLAQYSGKNFPFEFEFEKGRHYALYAKYDRGIVGMEVCLYNIVPEGTEYPDYFDDKSDSMAGKELIAFVPFATRQPGK
jgi:hypothetical protein